jgi:predicted DNA-binding transcriptional regulator AlpA
VQTTKNPLPVFIEQEEILKLLRVTSRTLRKWVSLGRFPRPLPIGRRRQFWSRTDVMRALGQRKRKQTLAEMIP